MLYQLILDEINKLFEEFNYQENNKDKVTEMVIFKITKTPFCENKFKELGLYESNNYPFISIKEKRHDSSFIKDEKFLEKLNKYKDILEICHTIEDLKGKSKEIYELKLEKFFNLPKYIKSYIEGVELNNIFQDLNIIDANRKYNINEIFDNPFERDEEESKYLLNDLNDIDNIYLNKNNIKENKNNSLFEIVKFSNTSEEIKYKILKRFYNEIKTNELANISVKKLMPTLEELYEDYPIVNNIYEKLLERFPILSSKIKLKNEYIYCIGESEDHLNFLNKSKPWDFVFNRTYNYSKDTHKDAFKFGKINDFGIESLLKGDCVKNKDNKITHIVFEAIHSQSVESEDLKEFINEFKKFLKENSIGFAHYRDNQYSEFIDDIISDKEILTMDLRKVGDVNIEKLLYESDYSFKEILNSQKDLKLLENVNMDSINNEVKEIIKKNNKSNFRYKF